MPESPLLIALGGGGFSESADPELDELVTSAVASNLPASRTPTIGYIGTANLFRQDIISRFHQRFGELGLNTTDLGADCDLNATESWLSKLDLLYVAGGNTLRLIDSWRKQGVDKLLCEAALSGLPLSGVSAGAICWFDIALIDGGRGKLKPVQGLGLFSGSCCPHHNSTPTRQSTFADLILHGEIPGGIAIDDGAAVKLHGDYVVGSFSARANAGAQRIRAVSGRLSTQTIFPLA